MSLSHRCGGILSHSSLQNCFNSATLEVLRAWKDCLRSCHSISIGVKSGLWLSHSKTLISFLLSYSELDLLMCLGSLSCCKTQERLNLRSNWWLDILLQDFLIECRIHDSFDVWQVVQVLKIQSRPDHHTNNTIFDCWYDVLFMKCRAGFTSDVTGHTPSKKRNFCLISPQNICPKVLEIIKIFFDKWETSLCVLFGRQWLLPWNSPMDDGFAQSLSYCWIMNIDLNSGKWGLQFSRCFLGVLLCPPGWVIVALLE